MTINVEDELFALAKLVADDLGVTYEQMCSKYNRGRVSRARQIFCLSAAESGLPKQAIAETVHMDGSYVTQVEKRNYKLKRTAEYLHALGWIKGRLEVLKNAKTR